MLVPPPQPDDTQPMRIRPRQGGLLLMVMILAGMSLLLTTLWWANRSAASVGPTVVPLTVELDVAGQRLQVQTTATTVGGLLSEQGIQLGPDDAISDPLDAPLRAGRVVFIDRARIVTLTIDGQPQTLRTPLTNPYDILRHVNVDLDDADRLWLDGVETEPGNALLWPLPVQEITLKRAVTLVIQDDGQTITHRTTADTIGTALFEAGITLYLADQVAPDVGAPLLSDTTVTIDRADPLTIRVDGTEIETRAQEGTVIEALAAAGVSLVGLDYTDPPEDAPIAAGMTIRVVRATEERLTSTEPVPYETVFVDDPALELDAREVRQAGQNGVQENYTRVRYEDGVEVSREPDGSQLVQAPVNEVVAYGTQIVLRSIDTPEGPREYWRKLRVYATSYHPAALGGDNVTSIGMTLQKGIIAADPRIIPYRTNLFVPDYGTGLMADTGGPRSSPYWIDLGYSDEDFVSWSRYVDVYLLTPVPAEINYLLPTWRPLRGR